MKIWVLIKLVVAVFLFIHFGMVGIFAEELFRAGDISVADFEGDSYGDWQVSGEAFGAGPAQGTLANQNTVSGFYGNGLVNSYCNGDGSVGRLISPEFKVERSYINFLIGGGGHFGLTCMNLLVDGEVVRSAEGSNVQPGGVELLNWKSWDVREFAGQKVQIEIVDEHRGGWGHINVDHIVQSDVMRQDVFGNRERVLTLEKKYLNVPVKTGASKRILSLYVDGDCVREFDVELATSEPDFWVYVDVSEFKGKPAILRVDQYNVNWSSGFDAIYQGSTFPDEEGIYREKLRPQFHYTSKRGWVNDTNGMVYYDGEYHLFYQHNPYGWDWGNMTWGHAVSSDMIHWQELGDAIHPDELGTIYSGSAVVDEQNSSGFQSGSEKVLVAFYTSAGGESRWSEGKPFTQSIAYSNDRGRTWVKYSGNPVIEHIGGGNRDPKVIWHEPTQKWVMILFIDNYVVHFFTSSDLKSWEFQSELKSFHECPELFELAVDGDSVNKKWVLYGANGDYFVGEFDGKKFDVEEGPVKFHYSNCFFASQTFNNIPVSDGRRIQMGWARGANMPGMPFNQEILFPVELTMRSTEQGCRLFVKPIREVEVLHKKKWRWSDINVVSGQNILSGVSGELFHILIDLDVSGAGKCGINVRNLPIVYDVSKRELSCLDKVAPLVPVDGRIKLELLVDRASVEIFANDGLVYMPMYKLLADEPELLELFVEEGSVMVKDIEVFELDGAWSY